MAPSNAGRKVYSSKNRRTPRNTMIKRKKICRIRFWCMTWLSMGESYGLSLNPSPKEREVKLHFIIQQ
jgi:hypothetical protein